MVKTRYQEEYSTQKTEYTEKPEEPIDHATVRVMITMIIFRINYRKKNPHSKTWWKICKHISGLKSSYSTIPPLLKDNVLIFDDIEKSIIFFVSQTKLK